MDPTSREARVVITGECLAVDGGNSIPRRSGRATEARR